MAFDGIVIAGLVAELQDTLAGGRITKIAQTEADKLLLTIKNSYQNEEGKTTRTQRRLVISVNPSLPLIYLTEENQAAPLQAPTFCMVLRKHLNNCKIQAVSQIGLERVIRIDLEHLNEMGDYCEKRLYIELMGKLEGEYTARCRYEKESRKRQQEQWDNFYKQFNNGGSQLFGCKGAYTDSEKVLLKKFYKILSQKFHPDSQGGSNDAMQLVNKLKQQWGV